MLLRILSVFFIVCSVAFGENLKYGMSAEDVRVELGRPESKMSLGEKEVWIYADGSRIEFVDGKLTKENDTALAIPKAEPVEAEKDKDPLIKAEEIVQNRENKTISASIQNEEINYASMGEDYTRKEKLRNLEKELSIESGPDYIEYEGSSRSRIQQIVIAFGIELVVTLLVLSIAFQISGFPSVFRQIFLLSLAVAIVGVILDLVLGTDPLSPIRSVAGLLVLLSLIRQLTDVREWATAIKIAIIARVVSFIMIWVLLLGVTMLFSL